MWSTPAHRPANPMALVDAKAEGASTSAEPVAPAHPVFLVVLDGVETPIHEGTLYGNGGGSVTVTGPGNLSADGLRSVLVRGGGAGTTVRFTLCADAAAEGVGAAWFDRCGAARAEGAREVSVTRCRAAEVERAGKVAVERCRDARLRCGGATVAARCRRADVESFGGNRISLREIKSIKLSTILPARSPCARRHALLAPLAALVPLPDTTRSCECISPACRACTCASRCTRQAPPPPPPPPWSARVRFGLRMRVPELVMCGGG